jgi:predicted DNA-binding transcriptional regulator AlpA
LSEKVAELPWRRAEETSAGCEAHDAVVHMNAPDTTSRVLNLAEAAGFVRCSRSHLCNIVKGKVPGVPKLASVRIGRRVLFRRETLEQWLREVESTAFTRKAC